MSSNRRNITPKLDVDWWVIRVDTIKRGLLWTAILGVSLGGFIGVRSYLDYRARTAAAAPIPEPVKEGPERSGYFMEIEGDVKVKKKGSYEWTKAEKKVALSSGDLVKTGGNSTARVLMFDGTEYTIKSDSLTMIHSSAEDPQTKARKIAVRVTSGAIDMSTARKNRADSRTEVTTPTSTADLGEMTQAGMSYNPDSQETNIQIYSGSGEVLSGTGSVKLSSLEGVTVTSDERIGPKVKLLPAPDLREPANLKQLALPDPAKERVGLSWREVTGAAGYHLLLSNTVLMAEPLVDFRGNVRDTSVEIRGLGEGTYFWKVSAIDSHGREGQPSRVRRFRILTASPMLTNYDVDPPKLSVEEPQLSGNIALVRGKTEAGVMLTLNGEQVDVGNDGSFFHPVVLTRSGKNELNLVAQDAGGNETRMTKSVFAEYY